MSPWLCSSVMRGRTERQLLPNSFATSSAVSACPCNFRRHFVCRFIVFSPCPFPDLQASLGSYLPLACPDAVRSSGGDKVATCGLSDRVSVGASEVRLCGEACCPGVL